ncbi:hypothetical protein TWF696_006856 [Orbilia brochopaga]|uniref:Uncharacterized protein n=1 Tax=Orbilia brochopaga TaxID=3140254 RepID=A0AAV9UQZ9_9PEZI
MFGLTTYLPLLAALSLSFVVPGAASPALLKRKVGDCEPFRMKGGETVPLPGALENGGKAVLIEGWYLESGKNCADFVFSNCTKDTKNQAFTISFRQPNKIVAFNDKHDNKWGQQLDSGIKPLDSVYPPNVKGERKLSILVKYGVDNDKPYYDVTYFTRGSCLTPKDHKKTVVRFNKRLQNIDARFLHFENKGNAVLCSELTVQLIKL